MPDLRHAVSVERHDHACLLFASPREQARAVEAFVAEGLARHERVIYILDQESPSDALDRLDRAGVDIDAALKDGALVLKTTDEAYLADGGFDPDRMLSTLRELVADALAAGHQGVRVSGEMIWATRGAPGSNELMRYEERVNELLAELPAAALCQYDARAFPPDVLAGALRTHPLLMSGEGIKKNPYYLAHP